MCMKIIRQTSNSRRHQMMNVADHLLPSSLIITILFLALSSTNVECVAQKQKDYEFVIRPTLQKRLSLALAITSKDNRAVLNGTTFHACLGAVHSFTCKAFGSSNVKWEFKYFDSKGYRQQWQDTEPVQFIDRHNLRLYDVHLFGHYRCTVYRGREKAFIAFRVVEWPNPKDHCYALFNRCQREKLCQNGGTCINAHGSYWCKCLPKHYGIHCQFTMKGKYEVAILYRIMSPQERQILQHNMPTRVNFEIRPFRTSGYFRKDLTFPKDNNLFNWVFGNSYIPVTPFLTFNITPKMSGVFEADVEFIGSSYSYKKGVFFNLPGSDDVNEVPFQVFGNTAIRIRITRKCDPGYNGPMCSVLRRP